MTFPTLASALLLLGTPAQAEQLTVTDLAAAEPVRAPAVAPPATDRVGPRARRRRHAPGDPLEGFNRKMFAAFQSLDKGVLRPVALGYKHAVPKPVRSGLRNALSNLGEPIVFLNFLLQLKPGKAVETLGRFVVNSTLGVGGLVDVAKRSDFRLPHRSNGLGNTLGVYGVKPGPYLFLPFLGPTTVRDLVGGGGDGAVLPLAVGKPFNRLYYQLGTGVVSALDRRAEADDELRALFDGAVDPYATLRSAYLQNRQGDIDALRGPRHEADKPTSGLDDPLDDPLTDPGSAAVPSSADSPPVELSDPLADPALGETLTPPAASPETTDPLGDPATDEPAPPVTRWGC